MFGQEDKISQIIQTINDHSIKLNLVGNWIRGQMDTPPKDNQLAEKIASIEQTQEKLQATLTQLWQYVTKRLDNIEAKIGIKIGGEVKW